MAKRTGTTFADQAPPTNASGGSGNAAWDAGVAALQRADQEEFLSEPYMAASAEAADHFEQAAKELADVDPEMSRQAAEVSVRLRRFVSLDWGDPEAVETSDDTVVVEEALVASGRKRPALRAVPDTNYPVTPPAEWFSNPHLKGPTPLTVQDDGRVFGHIALWGTCHTGHSQHGSCITPPRSNAGYAHFRTGVILTAEGSEIPVGHLTLDTRHANERLNAVRAAAHYDNTGNTVADVAVGDDEHGIWFSGALRPEVTPAKVRSLRSAPLSGDWRRIGGNLELVAALGVNMPGFPVPRPQGLVASGVVQSLVASGMIPPRTVLKPGTEGALSDDDLRYLKTLAQRERNEEAERVGITAEALAARVRRTEAERRVREFATKRNKGGK